MKSASDWLKEGHAMGSNKQQKLECYNQAIALQPGDANAYFHKGAVLEELGKTQEAIECYNQAINAKPDYANAYLGKGNVLIQLGKKLEALDCYTRAIQFKPDYSDAYYNKGSVLNQLGKYQESIEYFDKTINLKPDYANAYLNKGNALKALDKNQEALECYNTFIKLKPNEAMGHSNKGIILNALGRSQEALVYCNRSIQLKPDIAEALNNKGIVLNALGKYQEAITCFDKAISLKKNYALALYNKGSALKGLGRYQEAIEFFNQVLQIQPDYTNAYNNKANTLKALGRKQEAIDCLNRAIEIQPDNPLYFCNRGTTFRDLGQNIDALNDFKTASQLFDQGKIKNLTAQNLTYIKNLLKDIVVLEENVNQIRSDINTLDQNDAESKSFINNFNSVFESKGNIAFEIFQQVDENQNLSIQCQDSTKLEIEKLKSIVNQFQRMFAELSLTQQKQQTQMHKQENNLSQLNAFKDKFAESTMKFEEKKKQAENAFKANPILMDYYNGFINEFDIAFIAAQAISSGLIKFEGETNTYVSILSKAVSLLPLFGSLLSSGMDFLNTTISNIELKKKCNNISKFGVNTTGFAKIAEYIAACIILDVNWSKKIKNYQIQQAEAWLSNMKSLIKTIKAKAEDSICKMYQKNMSPQEALGHQNAQEIISEYIYSGNILLYNNQVQLDQLLSNVLNDGRKTQLNQNTNRMGGADRHETSCCTVYQTNGIVYENHALNQIMNLPSRVQKTLFDIVLAGSKQYH